ncbi:hypothetical protein Pmani_038819, partial [Petrolisthes manimaculis]
LCEPKRDLTTLCALITGDARLFSMFRRDAPPDACPFKGPFTFSYSRGHGLCSKPASTIDSCTSDSKLLFKYQACPDVQGTESSGLEGGPGLSEEDKFRCFAWERARETEPKLAYRMAQSGDATCNGVFSAYDGAKTLKISRAGSYSGCEFPHWVSRHRHWHALDHGASYSVSHRNTTLRLHHTRTTPHPHNTPSRTHTLPDDDTGQGVPSQLKASTEARMVCSMRREAKPYRAVFVTHFTTGCSSGYVCTVFYRRNGHIIEMQQGSRAVRAMDACHPMYFNTSTAPHTTLTSNAPSRRACPLVGVWVAGGGECGRDVTHLRAGCSSLHSLNFVNACPKESIKQSFVCHGNWDEDGSIYVVASPDDHPAHRYCIIASSRNYNNNNNNKHSNKSSTTTTTTNAGGGGGKMLQITAHAHSCPRHQVPPTTTLSINFTAQGECESANTPSGTQRHSPHFTTTFLLYILLTTTLNRISHVHNPR